MFGQGLIKGLRVTMGEFFHRKDTIPYPQQRRVLGPRVRGSLVFDPAKCIACGLCAKACPNRVLTVETIGKGKERRLFRYTVDIEYCLYCGLCVEACTKGAIRFVPRSHNPSFTRYGPMVLYTAEGADEAKDDEKEGEHDHD